MEKNLQMAAVIVFFHGTDNVIKLINNISESTNKIIVINNGSDKASDKVLEVVRMMPNVRVIDNETNMGIAYALNQGLYYAQEECCHFLLTMDQDSIISNTDVIRLKESLETDNVASVGTYYSTITNSINREVDYLITSGNMVKVDVALAIGGYNECLFIDSVDIEFSFRLRRQGYKLLLVKDTHLCHKIGELEYSPLLKIGYLSHNKNRFYYKFRNAQYTIDCYFKTFPIQCAKMQLCLWKDFAKIILIEKNKKEKLKSAIKGLRDVRTLKLQ